MEAYYETPTLSESVIALCYSRIYRTKIHVGQLQTCEQSFPAHVYVHVVCVVEVDLSPSINR